MMARRVSLTISTRQRFRDWFTTKLPPCPFAAIRTSLRAYQQREPEMGIERRRKTYPHSILSVAPRLHLVHLARRQTLFCTQLNPLSCNKNSLIVKGPFSARVIVPTERSNTVELISARPAIDVLFHSAWQPFA